MPYKALCAGDLFRLVSLQAFRLWPAVRSHSVPECVRLYPVRRSGSGRLYALTVCRSASGCIGAGVPALSGCTLSQCAAVRPAVFVQAFRLCPAVRSHSAPECVRWYPFRRSGSGRLCALTVRRSASAGIRSGVPALAGCRQLSPVIRSAVAGLGRFSSHL